MTAVNPYRQVNAFAENVHRQRKINEFEAPLLQENAQVLRGRLPPQLPELPQPQNDNDIYQTLLRELNHVVSNPNYFVQKLAQEGMLREFYAHSGRFLHAIKGVRNLDADYLKTLWDHFRSARLPFVPAAKKEKKTRTRSTKREIEEELEEEMEGKAPVPLAVASELPADYKAAINKILNERYPTANETYIGGKPITRDSRSHDWRKQSKVPEEETYNILQDEIAAGKHPLPKGQAKQAPFSFLVQSPAISRIQSPPIKTKAAVPTQFFAGEQPVGHESGSEGEGLRKYRGRGVPGVTYHYRR